MKPAPPSSRVSAVWWMHPAVALGIPTIIVAVSALAISPASYPLYWKTGKFVQDKDVLMALAAVAAFALGTLVAPQKQTHNLKEGLAPEIPWNSVRGIFNWCFWLCAMGYAIWTAVGVHNGLRLGTVLDALRGNDGAAYEIHLHYLLPIPGVTSLTQFGIAAIVLGVPLGISQGRKGVKWKILAVLAVGTVRALINSERLALIELALPCAVSWLWNQTARTGEPWKKRMVQAIPVISSGALFAVFSVSEYFRSWLNFYAAHEDNFFRFAGLRLIGYYTTAFNNAVLMVHSMTKPMGVPYFTAVFARHFPILKSVFDSLFPAPMDGENMYAALLAQAANPELNNPSGIVLPVVDYGYAGSLIYWLLAGVVCGYLYRSFRQYSAAGMFLYPVLFTSLPETPRVLYWSDGRVFPPLFLLIFSVIFVLYRSRHTFAFHHADESAASYKPVDIQVQPIPELSGGGLAPIR